MKLKSDVFDIVKSHITRAENYLGRKLKNFKSDNRGEFVNANFKIYFDEKGIHYEENSPFSPQQNRVIERFMQTAVNGVRTILSDSKLNTKFWLEALKYFYYT